MNFWLALRRLLPLLAVLSLALTPVIASAAAVGMAASMRSAANGSHGAMPTMDHNAVEMVGMDMEDMPCCPPEKPDCAKMGCPLMALCLTSVASLLPAALSVPMPIATRTSVSWPGPATFASVHGTPLPEPPRA